jgi:cytochrome c oxidase assembly protein subunit 15
VIASLTVWALVNRRDRGQPLIPVIALFAIVCLQASLGALTVTLLLKPLIVTLHLLGGLTTLGLLWWISREPERRDLSEGEIGLRLFALGGLAVLALQIALGGWTSTNYAAVACPDFPTCQGSWWPQTDYRDAFVLWRGLDVNYEGGVLAGTTRIAIHWTHRLGAVVVGSLLIALGLVTLVRARGSRLAAAAGLLLFAVLAQISIGIATVHWGVPLPLATLHNGGAALLVVAMVTLIRALWPAPSLAMVPLAGVVRTR